MERFLLYWGPTIFIAAVLIVAVRIVLSRYTRFFTRQAENAANQVVELREVRKSLDRIAAALEASPPLNRDRNSN
jgi:hypothetical protein